MARKLCALAGTIAAVTLFGPVVLPDRLAAAEPPTDTGGRSVHVVAIDGPMDEINRRFLATRLEAAAKDAQVMLIQLDSPGFLGGKWEDASDLANTIRYSRVPVVVWLGPAGATAERGAFWIYLAGHRRGVSPHSKAGRALPSGLREPSERAEIGLQREFLLSSFPNTPEAAFDRALGVEELTTTGLADFVAPTLGDAVVGLDGVTVTLTSPGEETVEWVLRTAEVITPETGPALRRPSVPVVFFRPGLIQRILHSAASPTVAYMLLAAAIVLFALEFYTAGIGIVALLGAVCLLISGYGLGMAGPNPITLAALGVSVPLFASDIQRGVRSAATLGGAVSTTVAVGAASLQGPDQLRVPLWAAVVLGLLYVAAWRIGVVVMVRTRFWAPVVARDKLVGLAGVVRDPLAPEGTVGIGKGRFPAVSPRGHMIRGEDVVVSGISGWRLVVKRAGREAEEE